MTASSLPRRRGHITQLLEAVKPEPVTDAELDLEIEAQLGMEIDLAMLEQRREAAPDRA